MEVPNPFPGFHTTVIKMPHIYDNDMTDPTQRDQENTKQSFLAQKKRNCSERYALMRYIGLAGITYDL